MKHINAFYIIGSVGMIIAAVLHMVMALFLLDMPNHGSWWGIYPVFLTFLIMGALLMYKDQKNTVQ